MTTMPSSVYLRQTCWSQHERTNECKSNIRNHSIQKPVKRIFNLPRHSIANQKIIVLKKKKSKNYATCKC